MTLREIQNIERWSRENWMTLNLSKTWEMVVRGKTRKPLRKIIPNRRRKNEIKLLGVIFNEDPSKRDSHFDMMLSKASSKLYILRIGSLSKHYGNVYSNVN